MDKNIFMGLTNQEKDQILNSILADHATSVQHLAGVSAETITKVLAIIKTDAAEISVKHGEKAMLAFCASVLSTMEIKSVALRSKFFGPIKKELMTQIGEAARKEMDLI
jgi:hypothetical protein